MTTIADLIHSNTAIAKGIDNTPATPELMTFLSYTALRVDEVRAILLRRYARAVLTSGYRCPALSIAVGGHGTDEHTKALAFDLDPHLGDAQANLPAARLVFDNRQLVRGAIHQVIAENGHVHIGLYPPGKSGLVELRVQGADGHYPLVASALV